MISQMYAFMLIFYANQNIVNTIKVFTLFIKKAKDYFLITFQNI